MFDGITRRVVSLWFPRLASDRVLRQCSIDGPFVVILQKENTQRIYCLNAEAEKRGLRREMAFRDARVLCPDLQSRGADLHDDQRFLHLMQRWALRYCPWVGFEGNDGLVLDVTGSTHLLGGEAGFLADMRGRLGQMGMEVRLGLADTRGAAWALSRFGANGVSDTGVEATKSALSGLPVAALRLGADLSLKLERLGFRTIGRLLETPRAPLARRFGAGLLLRLDQALGVQAEQIMPHKLPVHYGVRLTLPEPIGLQSDVLAGVERLLHKLCDKLQANQHAARRLSLSLRRVDQQSQEVELRLAGPLYDAARILPLFERAIGQVDAGFGIDQLRLVAFETEPVKPQQMVAYDRGEKVDQGRLDDLITRLGTRIGLENIQRFLPADSHIPERSFVIAPAAYTQPEGGWQMDRPRPIRMFLPEAIAGEGARVPKMFRWRRMIFHTAYAQGPERLAPEWWLEDDQWRSGLRDYWFVQTREGRRLWLFYTPQNPGWFVQGEFA